MMKSRPRCGMRRAQLDRLTEILAMLAKSEAAPC